MTDPFGQCGTAVKDLTQQDTIDGVTGFGVVKYNGYEFNIIRQVLISSRFVYDDAGVTITHVEYDMTVRGFIHGDDPTNCGLGMEALQDAMSVAGAELVIDGIGFDTKIDTDRGDETPDVLWGAQPQGFSFRPLGGNVTWEFTFQIKFNLSRCESANSSIANRFMAFNYAINYSTNFEGFVERTIEGYIQIAQNRDPTNRRKITWDIESAWDKVVIRVPVCFRRETTQRRINAARNRIDFTIVDRELSDLPYPNGIIEADADYDFENQGVSFENWVATMTVDFTVAPGYPPSLAAGKFFLMLADKVAKLRAAAAASKGAVIPRKLRISQKPFGRQSRFQAIIQVVACLKEILNSSGLWHPVPGTSYQQWAASMVAVNVWGPRGRGNWRHNPQEDAIIDLCVNVSAADLGKDNGGCLQPTTPASHSMLCPPGKPYLYYDNSVHAEQSQNVVIHKLSQFFPGADTVNSIASGFGVDFGQSSGSSPEDHVSQYEGSPDNYVIMVGRGIRIHEAPDLPKLVKIGGVEVEEVARKVVSKPIASYFGCPAIGSRWAILYRVKGQIKTVKPPNNKETLCFDKGEDDGK